MDNIDFSIAIPVYNNEGSLEETVAEIMQEVFEPLSEYKGEVVFVDDGSQDNSYEKLCQLHQRYPEIVKVIKLSRNFGQAEAIWCGLEHASGNATVSVSADGQDPANMIWEMLLCFFNKQKEIVICSRTEREDSLWRKATSWGFYFLMRKFCHTEMPVGGFDFFLIGKKAKKNLLEHYHYHGCIQMQLLHLGFNPEVLGYTRRKRKHGKSQYRFLKKLSAVIDSILGYSIIPMRLMSLLGISLASCGFIYMAILFVYYILWGHPVRGFTALIMVALGMGGLQLCMLGIIGEYIWRTKSHVMRNPNFVIDSVLSCPENSEQSKD